MWDGFIEGLVGPGRGVLACPWCGLCSRLHLTGIHYATPTDSWTRSVSLDIDGPAATVTLPGLEATTIAGDAGDGVLLAVQMRCEVGCRGRVEFRQRVHDDGTVLVLTLVELDHAFSRDTGPGDGGPGLLAGEADPDEPPF